MASAALRRVTDLFVEGTECVLDEQEPVLVWINKPNPFEVDDARRDGQAARTRVMLALEDPRSEESQLFDAQTGQTDDDTIVLGMAGAKYQEDLVRVSEEMRVDEEWADKVNSLERASEQLGNRSVDDPEVEAMQRLNTEYLVEMEDRVEARRQQRIADLKALPKEELRARYRKEWIESRASQAFITEFRISETFFALRECKATTKDHNGRWKHDACDHRQKLLDDRTEVRALPDGLLNQVRPILNQLVVDERSAKGLAGVSRSSASSQRPNEQEDSEASTQAEKPPAQATTSTPQ